MSIHASKEERTAVLVVHGMGSQRPLDTVRGIVDAVWRSDDDKEKQIKTWVHPEPSGIDLDLSVFTTDAVAKTANRNVDFHELYWAHLLSETRAVAVLLWLFELARRGPYLNPRMILVWWGLAVFLSFLIMSVAFLVIQGVVYVAGITDSPQNLLLAMFVMAWLGCAVSVGYSAVKGATRYVKRVLPWLVITAAAVALFYFLVPDAAQVWIGNQLLAVGVAAIAIAFLMGNWGLVAFLIAIGLSVAALAVYLVSEGIRFLLGLPLTLAISEYGLPWHLHSPWTAVAAWIFIGTYLILNAWFLQPYLGDVARYFRNSPANVAGRREIRTQAVKMLAGLHESGLYDRIIVVAHSLGTAVAYDMLRAYYARICRHIPAPPKGVDSDLDAVDDGRGTRNLGRKLIRKMAAEVADLPLNLADGSDAHVPKREVWLVTDFVTLGSPLVHAVYLMCNGKNRKELQTDFQRRKDEREFPTCPPQQLFGDGLLTFEPARPPGAPRRFHHGGMFALTRWTNLYFPQSEVLWGDVIGGPIGNLFERDPKAPLQECFGAGIKDVPVWTEGEDCPDFVAHVKYWDIECGSKKRGAYHILQLCAAINLVDKDEPEPAAAAPPAS